MRSGFVVGLVLLTIFGAVPLRAKDQPCFQDVARKSGILYRHHNRIFDNPYAKIMEGYTAFGAGAAIADYDGDGFEDVFVTDSCATCKNHLYHNNGNLTFTDVAEQAGVAEGNDAEDASAGALWFDFNNDGRPDLLVVRFGHNILYENLGGGKFRDVTHVAGLDRYLNAITAIAFDYDHDGYLDLFVGSYSPPINVFHPTTPHFFPESFEHANNGGGVTVFHNKGDGTFTEVTDKVGLRTSGWVLALGHGDATNDGWDDLYVADDFGTDRFFVNNRDGTFTDRTESAISFDTKKGMDAEWGDYDNDGYLDIYVTNITDEFMREGNFLWHNNGNFTFTDVARETGTYDTGWGWAGKFIDYDNDGWLDLYVADGAFSRGKESYITDVYAMVTRPGVDLADVRSWPVMGNKSLSGYQRNRLFHNHDGHIFTEESARNGVDSIKDARGVAIADFDNDGHMDMFVTNAGAEPNLYHNVCDNGAHWVQFLLQGTKSNREAVGAQVRIVVAGKTYLSFVNAGNGFGAESTKRVHFGLAAHTVVDSVEVRWPSGLKQTFSGLGADRLYKIIEGQKQVAVQEGRAR